MEGSSPISSPRPAPSPPAAPSSGGGSAVQREQDRMKAEAAEQDAVDNELIERQSALTEQHRQDYENSDQGAAARQVREAERLMRQPGPVTQRVDHEGNVTDEGGQVFGDPTRGPAS